MKPKVFRVQKLDEVPQNIQTMIRKLAVIINDNEGMTTADVFNCLCNCLGNVVLRGGIPTEMAMEAFAEVLARQENKRAEGGLLS